MIIDFRSDTVTRPTPAMLEAMMKAKVGDDVFGEDPSINELEELAATMFGMEAALFCPSGTMTNQIAIKCHTQPADEVICDESSHVYQYEGGGIAFNSGASVKLLPAVAGMFAVSLIEASAQRARSETGGVSQTGPFWTCSASTVRFWLVGARQQLPGFPQKARE